MMAGNQLAGAGRCLVVQGTGVCRAAGSSKNAFDSFVQARAFLYKATSFAHAFSASALL